MITTDPFPLKLREKSQRLLLSFADANAEALANQLRQAAYDNLQLLRCDYKAYRQSSREEYPGVPPLSFEEWTEMELRTRWIANGPSPY